MADLAGQGGYADMKSDSTGKKNGEYERFDRYDTRSWKNDKRNGN